MSAISQFPCTHNDLIGRWYGTRVALAGQDPYSSEVTRRIQAIAGHDASSAFDYPETLVVLAAPLARLPWTTFSLIYLLVVIPALTASFRLCIDLLHMRVSWRRVAAMVLAAIFSWPVMWGLRLLQPTLMVGVLLFLACSLLSRGRGAFAGFHLALATIKPQLVLPLLLWLALWTMLRRQWSMLIAFSVTTAVLLVLTEWLVPGWIPHWLASLQACRSLCSKLPLEPALGCWLSRLVALGLVGWTGWRTWQLRDCPARSAQFGYAAALVLAATTAVNHTQPLMIYNDTLLLPGCALLVCATTPRHVGFSMAAYRISQVPLAWTFLSVPVPILTSTIGKSPKGCDELVFVNPFLASAITLFLLLQPPPAIESVPAGGPKLSAAII